MTFLRCSARLGMSAPNWVNELTSNLNAMTRDIEQQVQDLTKNLNSQLQHTFTEIEKTIQNLPKGKIFYNVN